MKNLINKNNLLRVIGISPNIDNKNENDTLKDYGYSISEYKYNIPFKYFKNIDYGKKIVIVKSKNHELCMNSNGTVINLENGVLKKSKIYDNELIRDVIFLTQKESTETSSVVNNTIHKIASQKFLKEFDNYKNFADDKIIEKHGEDALFSIESESEYMSLVISLFDNSYLLNKNSVDDVYFYTILLIMKKNNKSIEVNTLNDLMKILELLNRSIK